MWRSAADYARHPADCEHVQFGSADWLLRELQIQAVSESNGAPRPVKVLNIGRVHNYRMGRRKRGVAECARSSSQTNQKGKTFVHQITNATTHDPRSSVSFEVLEVLKYSFTKRHLDFATYLLQHIGIWHTALLVSYRLVLLCPSRYIRLCFLHRLAGLPTIAVV